MIGRVLAGVYRLADLIGSGGFADVYLARDVRTNRVVAVKVLHGHLARDPQLIERFQREAQLAQRLHEPHIVRVLDAGEDAGTHYLVMEYVEGHTLDRILAARGRLPVAEVVDLARQVLDALAAAHAAGVTHRDIKPQNLMLTSSSVLKVMDFGIARQPLGGPRTQLGTYFGTPEYMSPEQVKGETVDGRSDLYSLAAAMFELLAGRPPFQAESPWKVLDQQVYATPPSLRQVRSDVPEALDAILQRALAKQPDQRFQDAAGMRQALDELLPRPVTTPPQPIPSSPVLTPPAASSLDRYWVPASASAAALALFAWVLLAANRPAAPLGPPPASSAPLTVASHVLPTAPVPATAVPMSTPSAAERLEDARRMIAAEQYPQALGILDALQQSDPALPGLVDALYETNLGYGRAALAQNSLETSRNAFGAALQIRPSDPAALAGLQQVELAEHWNRMEAAWGKDDEAATAALEAIMQINPEYRETRQKIYALLIARAERLLEADDRDGAAAALSRALEVVPSGAEAQQRLLSLTPTPTPAPTATTPPAPQPAPQRPPPAPPVRPAPAPQPPPQPRPTRPLEIPSKPV